MPGPDRDVMLAIAAEAERLGLQWSDLPGFALAAGVEHAFLARLRLLSPGASWRDVIPDLPPDWLSEDERRAAMGEEAYRALERDRAVAHWIEIHEVAMREQATPATHGPRPFGFGLQVPDEVSARALHAALLAHPERVAQVEARAESAADWEGLAPAGFERHAPYGWLVRGRTPAIHQAPQSAMAAWFKFMVSQALAHEGALTEVDFSDPAA